MGQKNARRRVDEVLTSVEDRLFEEAEAKKSDSYLTKRKPMHFVIEGNPGVGKTTLSEILASKLDRTGYWDEAKARLEKDPAHQKAVAAVAEKLGQDVFKEGMVLVTASELLSEDAPFFRQVLEAARGGTLCIDEFHLLGESVSGPLASVKQGGNSVGKEILDALNGKILQLSGELMVVGCGYREGIRSIMRNRSGEPGLYRRFAYGSDMSRTLTLHDFSPEEMREIASRKAAIEGWTFDEPAARLLTWLVGRFRGSHGFGNAGAIESAVELTHDRNVARMARLRREIQKAKASGEVPELIEQAEALLPLLRSHLTVQDVLGREPSADPKSMVELDQNVLGQKKIKRWIRKSVNTLKENLFDAMNGKWPEASNFNFVLEAPSGGGKTELAEAIMKVLLEAGATSGRDYDVVMPSEGKGAFVGHTESAVAERLDNTEGGGIIFDELSSLAGGTGVGTMDSFAQGFINTLVEKIDANNPSNRVAALCLYPGASQEILQNERQQGADGRFPKDNRHVIETPKHDEIMEVLNRRIKRTGFELGPGAYEEAETAMHERERSPTFNSYREARLLLDSAKKRRQDRRAQKREAKKPLTTEDAKLLAEDFKKRPRDIKAAAKAFDRFEGFGEPEGPLQRLGELLKSIVSARKKGKLHKLFPTGLRIMLVGSPGAGKSNFAKCLPEVLYAVGTPGVDSPEFVFVEAKNLKGGAVGTTESQVRAKFKEARGKTLIIDELTTVEGGDAYDKALVDEITSCINEYGSQMALIVCGYENLAATLSGQRGNARRLDKQWHLPLLGPEPATTIFKRNLEGMKYQLSAEADGALVDEIGKLAAAPGWAGGGDMDTLLQDVVGIAMGRTTPLGDAETGDGGKLNLPSWVTDADEAVPEPEIGLEDLQDAVSRGIEQKVIRERDLAAKRRRNPFAREFHLTEEALSDPLPLATQNKPLELSAKELSLMGARPAAAEQKKELVIEKEHEAEACPDCAEGTHDHVEAIPSRIGITAEMQGALDALYGVLTEGIKDATLTAEEAQQIAQATGAAAPPPDLKDKYEAAIKATAKEMGVPKGRVKKALKAYEKLDQDTRVLEKKVRWVCEHCNNTNGSLCPFRPNKGGFYVDADSTKYPHAAPA